MIFWIKKTDGTVAQLEDSTWRAKIYAAGPAVNDLEYVKSTIASSHLVSAVRKTQKRIDVFSQNKAEVLEFELNHAGRGKKLAGLLSTVFRHPGMFQLYNVDILPEQLYFYEHDLFPLARVDVEVDSANKIQKWYLLDSVTWYDYETPELKTLELEIKISSRVPRMDSTLQAITLTAISAEDAREEVTFEGGEAKIITDAAAFITKYDPDFIITTNGDSFVLPFLYYKASTHSLQKVWNLNRDTAIDAYAARITNQGGKTYFSYGRILYRPATQRLFGRLHLDQGNTFIYDQCRLQGLFEVTRLCRIPMHTSMRASIGKCLSSLQFYYATKQGLLIPWKPEIVEDGKNAYDLFVADRGGMVLKPSSGGVYERVGEIDFASLYPSIIRKYNISAETVNCECCPNSREHWVEELKMHICEREGIIARSLVLPLDKRKEYKRLKSNQDNGSRLRQIYNERSASLKWILVCCLARESPVLVQRNGIAQYTKIGSFIDSIVGEKEGILDCPEDILVAGVDHVFKSKFCKIKKILKIPNQQKLLDVVMDDGRRIVTTPNHPFYLLKNGNLVIEQASELQIGNFIPVAKKVLFSRQNEQFAEVIRTSSNKSGEMSESLLVNAEPMFQGDLGFVRIRKIEELDRTDDYVYCFQLADDEVPGFFAGDGVVFTHNCFGYLSYRNAKFGKIDCHIAVCALARETLVGAMQTAEMDNYRVIHGIVDSLWLFKKGATHEDYQELCEKIKKNTGFEAAVEGIYKWIVFLPSKVPPRTRSITNRYFGCFEKSNQIKVRGIEYRRHDTPAYFKECQEAILLELAKCDTELDLRKAARTVGITIFESYAKKLEDHEVSPIDLVITRRLSKNPGEYSSKRQLQVNAAMKLETQGLKLQAGQSISYVITRFDSKGKDRSYPQEFAREDDGEYDSKRYLELLADCCASVLDPLGVSKEMLLTRAHLLNAIEE